MAITLVNPGGLPEIEVYRQVSIATGSRLVHIAGQVAWDADGVTVGEGDLAAQVERCYLNIGIALAEVGGSFDDVAKLTVYVVDWTPDKMPLFLEGPPGRPRSWGSPRSRRGRCWGSRRWTSPSIWSRSKPPRSSTDVAADVAAWWPRGRRGHHAVRG
ncbi:hypothetical protein SANT12839_089720 [Streptomyces antimycoticus]|uniref:Enamine deaminase RidA n=1 Tax=Streptomyces antimycoticus TaxID=68175 RepID=A0A4D4KN73_9ACTN|nr:hypothetical protein SANT12839_089720 [Streptomyces antimycoticus]